MPAKQSNRWTFTLNNWTDSELSNLKTIANTLRFIIVGKEMGESGTPHLQGYLEVKKRCTLTAVKTMLGSRYHLEIAHGDAEANIAYCSKEGDVVIKEGSPVKQGQRKDLEEIKIAIDEGLSYEGLWENHFSSMVQYRRSFEEYANLKRLKNRVVPKVYFWWGKTGTGKTRGAFDLAESEYDNSFWVWPGGPWYDGYRGQRVAIFDEFHGGDEQGCPFSMWKKLCDRYSLTVPIKGGFTNWAPEVIIFTSNIDPKLWWARDLKPADWWEQVERRITEIKEFI